MKRVELTHAEVQCLYGTQEVLKEIKTEKGTIFNFSVKVKVNDRSEKSPFIFESCSYFAKDEDTASKIRAVIKKGNKLDIKGFEERRGYEKDGVKKYVSSISVKEIVSLNASAVQETNQTQDDNLPF